MVPSGLHSRAVENPLLTVKCRRPGSLPSLHSESLNCFHGPPISVPGSTGGSIFRAPKEDQNREYHGRSGGAGAAAGWGTPVAFSVPHGCAEEIAGRATNPARTATAH